MLFFYSANNQDGQPVRGTIDAVNTDAARQALKEMDLLPEELHEATLQEKRAVQEGVTDFLQSPLTPNLVLEGGAEMKQAPLSPAPPPEEEKTREQAEGKKPLSPKKSKKTYFPFTDTLRLYAGWLLAWYCAVYMLGGYQYTRNLPFRIPYVEALLPPFSPIVLSFTLAAFLFLLCTSLQKALGGGKFTGATLGGLGIVAFALYRLNV